MKLPFDGVALETNDPGFYCYVSAIVLFVARCIGASNLGWAVTLVAITGLILLPAVFAWVVEQIEARKPTEEDKSPAKGGDVDIKLGAGKNGGAPGRMIIRRPQARPDTPVFVLFDEQTGGQFNVLMGAIEPNGHVDAPNNSFYIEHSRNMPASIWWKSGDGNRGWDRVLGLPRH